MPRTKKQQVQSSYAASNPTLEDLLASRTQANRVTSDFLKVDVSTALTFAGIALNAENPEKRARNAKSARRGYDTVVHLLSRVTMSEEDAEEMNRNLKRLKSELRKLGEKF